MRVWEETKVSQRQGLDLIDTLYQRMSRSPFLLEGVEPRPRGERGAVPARAMVRLTTGAGPHASPAEFDATPAAPHVIAPPVLHYRARAPGARAGVGGLPAPGRGFRRRVPPGGGAVPHFGGGIEAEAHEAARAGHAYRTQDFPPRRGREEEADCVRQDRHQDGGQDRR